MTGPRRHAVARKFMIELRASPDQWAKWAEAAARKLADGAGSVVIEDVHGGDTVIRIIADRDAA